MKTYLVVIFMIGGQPTIIEDGFSPLEMDVSTCAARREFALDYLARDPSVPDIFGVYCGTREEIQNRIDIELTSTIL